jgi:hypothetical protein
MLKALAFSVCLFVIACHAQQDEIARKSAVQLVRQETGSSQIFTTMRDERLEKDLLFMQSGTTPRLNPFMVVVTDGGVDDSGIAHLEGESWLVAVLPDARAIPLSGFSKGNRVNELLSLINYDVKPDTAQFVARMCLRLSDHGRHQKLIYDEEQLYAEVLKHYAVSFGHSVKLKEVKLLTDRWWKKSRRGWSELAPKVISSKDMYTVEFFELNAPIGGAPTVQSLQIVLSKQHCTVNVMDPSHRPLLTN